MPLYAGSIATWEGSGWKIRSKSAGKAEHLTLIKLCLDHAVKNKKLRKCIRTQDIYKVFYMVTSEQVCFIAIADENFPPDIIWSMLNKLSRECAPKNGKYLKSQVKYFSTTPHEKIREVMDRLNSFKKLPKPIDDSEAPDPLRKLDLKKTLKNIRKEAKGGGCNIQ